MKYNPKEHDVYLMGKTLSDLFKQKWEKDEEGITEKYRYDQAGGAQSGQQDTSTGSFPLTTNSDERAHVLSSAATACAPLPCSYALTSHSLSSFCPVLLQGKGRCGLVMVLSLACFAAGKRLMDSEFKDDRPMTYDEKRALSINMNKLPERSWGQWCKSFMIGTTKSCSPMATIRMRSRSISTRLTMRPCATSNIS